MNVVDNFYAYLWPGVTMQEMQTYGNNSNSYLVAEALPQGKHVLVDPGMVTNEARQNCLERLVSEMLKDGFKIEDVGLVLNTHAHPDHYGASEKVREMSGAVVAIGNNDDDFLKMAGGEMASVLKQMGYELPEIHPDFYLTEGELRLNEDLVAQVILDKGHRRAHGVDDGFALLERAATWRRPAHCLFAGSCMKVRHRPLPRACKRGCVPRSLIPPADPFP